MEIKETRTEEGLAEVVCDACGKSCTKDREKGLHEFGTLSAAWGYHSQHDGESYQYQLCETCFFKVLAYLQEQCRPLDLSAV